MIAMIVHPSSISIRIDRGVHTKHPLGLIFSDKICKTWSLERERMRCLYRYQFRRNFFVPDWRASLFQRQ